ncbi:MAG: DUF3313 family protein [Candidatus Competibacterales bacterium]
MGAIVLFSGCSGLLQPEQAHTSAFLGADAAKLDQQSGLWISEPLQAQLQGNSDQYTQVLIRPVDTEYLMKIQDWSKIQVLSEDEIREEAKKLAVYMKTEFEAPFVKGQVRNFRLVESPGPNTLVMEMAITELVPTDVARNAAGDVLGFLVPGGGLVSAGAGGSIAMEFRLVDGETGDNLALGKDRRVDQITPVDIAGLTPYRHTEVNVQSWAKDFAAVLNGDIEPDKIAFEPFRLSPW